LRETFADDFDAFDPYAGRWTPHFDHNSYRDWRARTLPANGEAQIYVDPRYRGSAAEPLGLDPFGAANGVLRIAAQPAPPEAAPFLHGYRFLSGMITSRASLLQAYGYFEIRARMPAGAGTWPAFWLLAPGRWPPEIDVLEFRGGDSALRVHVHWSEGGHRSSGCSVPVPDARERFHAYGVLWTPDAVTWYIDRAPVAWIRTKPGLDRPMYLLANLALGGRWAGPPDPSTPFPAAYEIDRIAAYALEEPR
jgi:beta-glucanase (GH16 family)